MDRMTVKTAAKINLALDVTGKLPNGYHTIESIFQTVGIYDEITVELTASGSGITISCEIPGQFAQSDSIPCDERNIAYKAAAAFFTSFGIHDGCKIHIKKKIPSQAGMGGGSSDAAAVLYCLNRLYKHNKEEFSVKLAEIAAKIGADVPFFLTGGTAFVSGIGEKISPIKSYAGKILVIGKGMEGVSTAEAYRNIDALENPLHPQTAKLKEAIEAEKCDSYLYFGNLFEEAVSLKEVGEIKEEMLLAGALSSVMTGSGSAVFGLFDNKKSAEKCAERLAEKGFFSCICETVDDSFIEI